MCFLETYIDIVKNGLYNALYGIQEVYDVGINDVYTGI